MADELEYIDLVDFTPGVRSNFFTQYGSEIEEAGAVIPTATDGAAQENGTYGCVALPKGGLGPLPRARAYLQDTWWWDEVTPEGVETWEPEWANSERPAPVRVPIVAARIMPAHVGPARSPEEDVPATEPLSHDPLVYWHFGDGSLENAGTAEGLEPFETLMVDCPRDSFEVVSNPFSGGLGSLFPADPFFGVAFWARRCDDQDYGGDDVVYIDVGADGGTGFIHLELDVSGSQQVWACPYNSFTPITTQSDASFAEQEWHYYWACITPDADPGYARVKHGVDDTDLGDTPGRFFYDFAGDASALSISDWAWAVFKYQDEPGTPFMPGSIPDPNGRIIYKVGEGWDIFGMTFFDGVIDVPDFTAIWESQGPALATFVPGEVIPGHRPDLTSGDLAFPAAIPVTYDNFSPSDEERMIGRLYKPWLVDPQDGPNLISGFFDMYDETIP